MGIINRFLSATDTAAWAPWLVLGAIGLYMVGYVDAGVHAASIGAPGILGTVHEFFHHARHVAFMCH